MYMYYIKMRVICQLARFEIKIHQTDLYGKLNYKCMHFDWFLKDRCMDDVSPSKTFCFSILLTL